ncbi:hypothetical protein ACQ4PT_049774 [Festuca glaucescens]
MARRCWFFLAWWLPLTLTIVAAEGRGEGCSVKRCGNVTISSPFWLYDIERGRSCGSLDFEVACYNNSPVLRSSAAFGFAILEITYEERSLHVIDLWKVSDLLHASNSCNAVPTWNTSDKLGSPFQISNINLNLILYKCTEAVSRDDRGLVETKMGCRNQNKVFARMGGRNNETSEYGGYAVEGCSACVVPVLGLSSEAEVNGGASASDYERLIRDGFLLTWDPLPLLLHSLPATTPPHRPGCVLQLSLTLPASFCWKPGPYARTRKLKV